MRKRRGPLVAVTGSQEPYIYDLPHLLALPSEFEFRFRYRPQWVEAEVLSEISENNDLYGRTLIILFHSQQNRVLIPIRRATVARIERLGPMVFVRFRVGALVNVLPDSPYRRQNPQAFTPAQLHQLAGRFLEDEPERQIRDYSKGLGNGMYLRNARSNESASLWSDSDDASAWASLVQVLQSEPSLEGVPMFHLLGFQQRADKPFRAVTVRNRFLHRKDRIQGFRLVERQRYRLRVIEWAEPPNREILLPQVRIQCLFDANTLELEGASNLVVGRYDTLEFSFSTRRPGHIELAIRAEPLRADSQPARKSGRATSPLSAPTWRWMSWPAILALRVPIKVSYSKRRMFGFAVLGLTGIATYLFSDSLTNYLNKNVPFFTSLPMKQALQVVGLYTLLLSWGDYVDKFLRVRTEVLRVEGSDDDRPKPLLI